MSVRVSVCVELHLSLFFRVERVHVGDWSAAAAIFGCKVAAGDGVVGAVGHLELVHGLFVLAQVVQTGELFEAEVTLKGSFAGVFADVSGQMLRPGEDHRAARVACALEKLALGLFRHAVAGCCWCR